MSALKCSICSNRAQIFFSDRWLCDKCFVTHAQIRMRQMKDEATRLNAQVQGIIAKHNLEVPE